MRPNESPAVSVAILGSGIIAITYGLARFVLGLFLPGIRSDLGLSPSDAGIIGALPFISFITGILLGPRVCQTVGPRLATASASGLAAVGLLSIAYSRDMIVLGVAVAICGISTGLSSPALAQTVRQTVRRNLRGRVNALHNAGTSLGIILAMPAMSWWLDDWRSAYTSFGLLAGMGSFAALICLPKDSINRSVSQLQLKQSSIAPEQWRAIIRLGGLAGCMGFVSSVYWIFAPDLLVQMAQLKNHEVGWIWLAVGVGGLSGSFASDFIDRLGASFTHAGAFFLLASSLLITAFMSELISLSLLGAAVFGAAYMTLTGFYLVRGVRIMEQNPALGPVIPLLCTTVGQAMGSALSGWVIESFEYITTFAAFSVFGLLVAVFSRNLVPEASE